MSAVLRRDEAVFVLDLGDGENRFNPRFVTEFNSALDEVVAADGPKALVTCATGKFWSNGLDLEWMASAQDQIPSFLTEVHALFARVLEAAVPTVAAVQGHAFAAGAMLAIAHDRVVMRSDRGYWCVPEVDIGLPFTPGMTALLQARLTVPVAHEAMTTGRRYSGPEAVRDRIAAVAVAEHEVLASAKEWAATQSAKNAGTLGAIKQGMYGAALQALRGPQGAGTPGA